MIVPRMPTFGLFDFHRAEAMIEAGRAAVLRDTGARPSCIELELTESVIMRDSPEVAQRLRELTALGIRLAVDDFGTGYSSLSYLHRFPIDTLKVDRSFVGTMEDGSENGEIVRTVIALAKTLGMDVVAEGIETIHQLHQLQILGCEYGQGYLFSKPVPEIQAENLLREGIKNFTNDDSFVFAANPELVEINDVQ